MEKQPSKPRKPRKPWNEQTKAEKTWTLISSLLGIALIIGCIVWVIVIATQTVQQDNAEDAQANATATVQGNATATRQAILALTPTPTPTLVHRITDIVTHHKSDDGYSQLWGVITGVAQTGAVYRVDVTLNESGDANEVQQDAYVVLDALYNSSLKPSQVTVRMFGPCTDKYGNQSTCQWAVVVLTEQTEKLFHWPGLDYGSAWAVYDQAEYLVNGL